jgi:hypothetical protein
VKTMSALLAFWRMPYSASMFRRFAYSIAGPPLAVLSLALALAGHGQQTARYQRHLAGELVWPKAGTSPTRPANLKVIAASVIILAVGVTCWLWLWRFTYALLPLPLAAGCLTLVLAGRIPAMNRYQRRMAGDLVNEERVPQRLGVRVVVHSIAMVVVGLVCWLLLAYLLVFAVGNLAFPFLDNTGVAPTYGGPPPPWVLWSNLHFSFDSSIWASTYNDSNGGPTAAGAWAYHVGQFLVALYPLFAWAIRGLTWLQGWLTQALLGGPAVSRPSKPSPPGHGLALFKTGLSPRAVDLQPGDGA